MLAATPACVWLGTPAIGRADQIAAGLALLRVNLAATGLGLGLHPVSQCLQEFPEMAAAHERAHELLGALGETVQMPGRLGYGPRVPRKRRSGRCSTRTGTERPHGQLTGCNTGA
jgi:hypothetical protein